MALPNIAKMYCWNGMVTQTAPPFVKPYNIYSVAVTVDQTGVGTSQVSKAKMVKYSRVFGVWVLTIVT